MSTQRYSVSQHRIETLLTWVKNGEIAIPDIERPFIWEAAKVRNLLDSLYQGFPVGYLMTWRNSNTRLKDGSPSTGKWILLNGQQRFTALMAALLGLKVLTKDYATVSIKVAFHPLKERFEISNPAIQKDSSWIKDISDIFLTDQHLDVLADIYLRKNIDADRSVVLAALHKLHSVIENQIGVIELSEELDTKTITEIFIRVNSAGVSLSQADLVMTKLAADEEHHGNHLRKSIDYFCQSAAEPAFIQHIEQHDTEFAQSDSFLQMRWLKGVNEHLYDPSYSDLLRVAYTSEFRQSRLQDLVALLSGRNFETKQHELAIADDTFKRLSQRVMQFMDQTRFQHFTSILSNAGFISSSLINGQGPVNFSYVVYLLGCEEKLAMPELEQLVSRWFVMSMLRNRYAGNTDISFDYDIRQIEAKGLTPYTSAVLDAELTENYWATLLPQEMNTASNVSPYFFIYKAAQIRLGDKGFLSQGITVRDLIINKTDVHYVYPRNHLKKQEIHKGSHSQIANLVIAQSEINLAIRDRAPSVYFKELYEKCKSGQPQYGGIKNVDDLCTNLMTNCVPVDMLHGEVPTYDDFLVERRSLMARKINHYFEHL